MVSRNSEHLFTFKFQGNGSVSKLTVPVTLPLVGQSVDDLVGRLIKVHTLPVFIVQDLCEKLNEFIEAGTTMVQEKNTEEAVDRLRSGHSSVDSLVAQWTKAFQDEVKVYSTPAPYTAQTSFSEVYHTLIHSNALETLLNLEHTYSLSVQDILEQRDLDLQHLEERQAVEMEEALANVGVIYTDEQINQLALRSLENTQFIESKWLTELNYLQDSQKKEYREWVVRVHRDSHGTPATPGYVQRVRALTNSLPPSDDDNTCEPGLEESFTIHLGAQMKTTHNLRLLCADPLDLCRHTPNTVAGLTLPQPQRLSTAMNLYSNSLCGLVLLVDDRLNFYTGIKREFAKVCEQSTDFHFPSIDEQLAAIHESFMNSIDWRAEQRLCGDDFSINSNSSDSNIQQQYRSTHMHVGDMYITKHSNLSDVHVVFHMVTDDSIRLPDLTSRDPVILALRNVLKMCFRNDIYTLTIPLLLANEMHEEMTIAWCLKRAELILKCIKGFMMEMSTWGTQESRTIQFLVPQGMSEEMFNNISNLVTQIFRLSNPVFVKSS